LFPATAHVCAARLNPSVEWLLLRMSKLESTVRYLGIDVDDALEIAEQIEV
jgi:hypothetical protein